MSPEFKYFVQFTKNALNEESLHSFPMWSDGMITTASVE